MDAGDDQALVRSAAGGDLEAFAEIVRRHQSFVYGAVLRVVRNPAIAEDLSQETFIRAFRGLGDFRGDSQVRSWLYRIATNLALNAVTRRKEFPSEDIPEEVAPAGPESQAETAAMGSAMREAIEALPPDLARPLMLREYDGLSYEEIAATLELPLNTVRTRIFRARRALRDELEEWR